MNGKAMPAKLLPPPVQPTITSGSSPAISSCSIASWPMIVWCISTWLSTEPSAYLVSSCVAATSTASLIAMPSEPGCCGSFSRIARPLWVSGLGLAWQVAP
jgi:hypothetical protein